MMSKQITKGILYVIIGLPTSLFFLFLGYIAFLSLKYPPPDCDNTNPVFESNSYDSNVYRVELIKLLKTTKGEETKFWFSKYIDSNHIAVTIQNDKICAKGHITVKEWEGFMKHLKEVEGKSYGGTLVGLKYSLIEDKNKPEIILVSVQDIID